MNKVSIIIPTYNEEKYIEGCLKTLLKQSYKNIEIIIVDDGSKDNTLKILKTFKKNKNIKVLRQNHRGPGKARNLGVKKAKGKILIFVDADMEFDKNYIKNLVKPIINKKAIGTIHTKEYILNKENIWARFWGPRIVVDKNNKGEIFRAITKKTFLKFGPFNPRLGYADDQTIYKKSGLESLGVNAICYHKNPSSLKEVYKQSIWIGSSYDFKILDIPIINIIVVLAFSPLIPIYIFYLTIKKIYENKNLEYLLYPIFAIVKYAGSIIGVLKRIFLKKKIK